MKKLRKFVAQRSEKLAASREANPEPEPEVAKGKAKAKPAAAKTKAKAKAKPAATPKPEASGKPKAAEASGKAKAKAKPEPVLGGQIVWVRQSEHPDLVKTPKPKQLLDAAAVAERGPGEHSKVADRAGGSGDPTAGGAPAKLAQRGRGSADPEAGQRLKKLLTKSLEERDWTKPLAD